MHHNTQMILHKTDVAYCIITFYNENRHEHFQDCFHICSILRFQSFYIIISPNKR